MTRKYKTLGKDLIDMELILESSGQLGLLWATPVRPVRGTGQTGEPIAPTINLSS
jgi:hypothetical protein